MTAALEVQLELLHSCDTRQSESLRVLVSGAVELQRETEGCC